MNASLPVTTTASAPARAAESAIARPMPWVEPVTTTTRPFTRRPPVCVVVATILDQKFRLSNTGKFVASRGRRNRPHRIDKWKFFASIDAMAEYFPLRQAAEADAIEGGSAMRTIKGPGLFLAQFATDTPPHNTLPNIARWAKGYGYKAIQIPTWDRPPVRPRPRLRQRNLLRRDQGNAGRHRHCDQRTLDSLSGPDGVGSSGL